MIKNNIFGLSFPRWFHDFLKPCRYKILYGGRGGGKSWVVADFLLLKSLEVKGTILCCREFQNSISVSVLSLLKDRIEKLGLEDHFIVKANEIICKSTGVNFIFSGLDKNIGSIKSIHNIIYCWVEEGAYISRNSWTVLTPSVRAPNSEIIVTFNPLNKDDVVYNDFIASNENLEDVMVKKISYKDNPYYSEAIHKERLKDLKVQDNDTYQHIWEGECLEHSDAQVFKGRWQPKRFQEPENVHYYYGLDFGFSKDPTACIRCCITDDNEFLYITHEAVKVKLDINKTADFLRKRIPDIDKYTIYADNARPETISQLKKENGLVVKAVEKGKGSIEDGIEYIKKFKIIIHPRCVETIKEFKKYQYKTDKRSGEITNKIEDANNHCIDALRYALEKCMKRGKEPTVEDLKRARDYFSKLPPKQNSWNF